MHVTAGITFPYAKGLTSRSSPNLQLVQWPFERYNDPVLSFLRCSLFGQILVFDGSIEMTQSVTELEVDEGRWRKQDGRRRRPATGSRSELRLVFGCVPSLRALEFALDAHEVCRPAVIKIGRRRGNLGKPNWD